MPLLNGENLQDPQTRKRLEKLHPTGTHLLSIRLIHSIRALFGTDGTKNAVHGSDSIVSAEREITLLFGEQAARLSQFISLPGSKVVSRAGSTDALTAARDSVTKQGSTDKVGPAVVPGPEATA